MYGAALALALPLAIENRGGVSRGHWHWLPPADLTTIGGHAEKTAASPPTPPPDTGHLATPAGLGMGANPSGTRCTL